MSKLDILAFGAWLRTCVTLVLEMLKAFAMSIFVTIYIYANVAPRDCQEKKRWNVCV